MASQYQQLAMGGGCPHNKLLALAGEGPEKRRILA